MDPVGIEPTPSNVLVRFGYYDIHPEPDYFNITGTATAYAFGA